MLCEMLKPCITGSCGAEQPSARFRANMWAATDFAVYMEIVFSSFDWKVDTIWTSQVRHTTAPGTSHLIWGIMLAMLWDCINNLMDNAHILGILSMGTPEQMSKSGNLCQACKTKSHNKRWGAQSNYFANIAEGEVWALVSLLDSEDVSKERPVMSPCLSMSQGKSIAV